MCVLTDLPVITPTPPSSPALNVHSLLSTPYYSRNIVMYDIPGPSSSLNAWFRLVDMASILSRSIFI